MRQNQGVPLVGNSGSMNPNQPMKNSSALSWPRMLRWLMLSLFVALAGAMLWPRGAVTDAKRPSAPATNKLPELAPIPTTKIGLGQRLFFGIGAIDEEGDDVCLNLVRKPASAKFNQKTLTVDWTPTPQDGKAGEFEVRVTETPHDPAQKPRTFTRAFTIAIQSEKVQLLNVPPAPMEVDALVSVIDPERLGAANEQWPIVKMFDQIAAIEADKQVKPGGLIGPTTGAALFHDMLKNLAAMHHNDAIDPDSPNYNPMFNAENWRLTTVRPRFNKRVFELRLVYFNVVAAEPVYVMPRLRIVRGKDPGRPEDQRQKNNKAFAQLFYDEFFNGDHLKPFVATDKKAYGLALADLITKVVNYRDPSDPAMRANFAALPHNSRLGGGNKYDASGKYLSGDGWALGAMKVVPVTRDGKQVLAFVNPPIDGFATSIKQNADGSAFAVVPAPRFDPKSSSFVTGWDALIDPDDHGNIAIPEVAADGSVHGSAIDSTTTAFDFKTKWQVAETTLRDPVRRIFEERGMTCTQCHVRNFDDGDMLKDARNTKGNVGAVNDIPRVFFVVIPTIGLGRNEFIRRNEEEQLAALQGVLRDYLGVTVDLHSPLGKTWPQDTRKGRS
jgi:hypothetical protein